MALDRSKLVPDPAGRPGHWLDPATGDVYSLGAEETQTLSDRLEERDEAPQSGPLAARLAWYEEKERLADLTVDVLKAECEARQIEVPRDINKGALVALLLGPKPGAEGDADAPETV